MNTTRVNTRFLWLWAFEVSFERKLFDDKPIVIAEAPKSPFESVTLASEQEIGLFARIALPRLQQ